MGITVGPTFTTDSGFTVEGLYISIDTLRYTITPDNDVHSVFTVQAFKSRDDKKNGCKSITLPQYLKSFDTFLDKNTLQSGNIFTIAYEIVRRAWAMAGFMIVDIIEPGQSGFVEPVVEPVVEPTSS